MDFKFSILLDSSKFKKVDLFDKKVTSTQAHPFHLVRPSAFPFLLSLALPSILFRFVLYMKSGHKIFLCPFLQVCTVLSVVCLVMVIGRWLFDVHFEGSVEGQHTRAVQGNLLFGFALFIVSEVRLFFSFFWAFAHLSVHPSIIIGEIWPPIGIVPLYPFGLPLVNTILLLSSGVCVTFAHHSLTISNSFNKLVRIVTSNIDPVYYNFFINIRDNTYLTETCKSYLLGAEGFDNWSERSPDEPVMFTCVTLDDDMGKEMENLNWSSDEEKLFSEIESIYRFRIMLKHYVRSGLGGAIFLGILFTICQVYEYNHTLFDISDSVYGATFFITTGLHGLHVLVGTGILIVQFIRLSFGYVYSDHNVGFLTALWYWHFVDIVWLGVFAFLYVWGSAGYFFI